MKRKLLNAVLFASALVAAGTFSSCKDNDEDLKQEWNQQNLTMQEKVTLLQSQVDALKQAQTQCREHCENQLKDILRRLGVAEDRIEDVYQELLEKINNCKGDGVSEQEVKNAIIDAMKDAGIYGEDGTPVANFTTIVQEFTTLTNLITGENGLQKRVEDLENMLNGIDLAALQAQVNSNSDAIRDLNTKLDTKLVEITTTLTSLSQSLTTLQGDVTDIKGDITNLQNSISTINTTLTGLQTSINEANSKAIQALTLAQNNETAITAINTVTIPALEGRIQALETWKNEVTGDITEINSAIETLKTDLGDLKGRVETLETQYSDLERRIGDIETLLESVATTDDLEKLTERVQANEDAIAVLQGQMNQLLKIYDYLNSLITGVIMQQAVNPIFGNFSLPIGVQSNMLVNYWGQYTGAMDLVFPSHVQGDGIDGMLTQEDARMLAGSFEPLTIKNGEYLIDDAGLGTVYLTINPANVNFTGGNLVLETSGGNVSGAELRNVRRSFHDLKFGVSRAENNGFYEADVVLPANASAISKTKIEVTDGLKSSIKNVLQDRSKKNLLTLARKVFDQVSQGLPAYSIAAYWDADNGQGSKKMSVRSNYDLAVATFRPLSYNTYKGESIDKKFPTHGPLKTVKEYLDEHFNNDRFHFSLGDQHINVEKVDFNFNLDKFELRYDGTVIAHSPGVDVEVVDNDGNTINGHTKPFSVTVTSDDLKPLIDDLNRQLNEQIDIWNKQLKDHFDEAMAELVDNVNKEVERAMKDLELNINDQIDKILDDLKADMAGKLQPYMDKVNRLIEKYNDVADRLNKFLENPNHYLQVNMIYNAGNGDIQNVSNDVNDPTIVKRNGGNGITVIATSYTMELAAPAYKKFVAVTNVWDANGNSAKGGNATLKSQLQSINKGGTLCKVLPGNAKRIAIDASNMKAGYKYEIVYTAVDYRGYTSTQHFYLKIK